MLGKLDPAWYVLSMQVQVDTGSLANDVDHSDWLPHVDGAHSLSGALWLVRHCRGSYLRAMSLEVAERYSDWIDF
jgi:hypothetical protein